MINVDRSVSPAVPRRSPLAAANGLGRLRRVWRGMGRKGRKEEEELALSRLSGLAGLPDNEPEPAEYFCPPIKALL